MIPKPIEILADAGSASLQAYNIQENKSCDDEVKKITGKILKTFMDIIIRHLLFLKYEYRSREH